jgi:UDP-N-acetylglucosamine 1-carboxyvinyltransferase
MAMLLAAVCAEGVLYHQQRRPDRTRLKRIDERLNALGAKITRVPARVNGA